MSTDEGWFDREFADLPLMVILRGHGPQRSVALAEQAWRAGIRSIEIPIQSGGDLDSLRAVARSAESRGYTVGAGTIVDTEQLHEVRKAGAAYTVSPGFDRRVVESSLALGMPTLPGVATPTEIQRAGDMGLSWMKAFPAAALGPSWFSAMRGPFPGIRLVAVGGVTLANANELLDAGARAVALGSALADEHQLSSIAGLLLARHDDRG